MTMKKTTVQDVCSFMDAWAPPSWAYPWDRIGLHTGCPEQTVTRVLVCLTITPTVVATAIRNKTSMIVSHHPLIWEPLKTLRSDDPLTRMYLDLCGAGIACFSAHTNLDIAPGGVNAALAAKLHLQETHVLFKEAHLKQIKLVVFVPKAHQKTLFNALAQAGAGGIGNYTHCSFNTAGVGTFRPEKDAKPFCGTKGTVHEEQEVRLEMLVDKGHLQGALAALRAAHPYEEPAYDIIALENPNNDMGLGLIGLLEKAMSVSDFLKCVQKQLALPHAILYSTSKKKVQKVAVLGGSGGDYVARMPADVDAYVTGDIGYHHAETARLSGLACIDATHYGTELPIVDEIASRLRKTFPAIKVATTKEKQAMGVIAAD